MEVSQKMEEDSTPLPLVDDVTEEPPANSTTTTTTDALLPENTETSTATSNSSTTTSISDVNQPTKSSEVNAEYPPNQTLYISNLNEKIKKEDLRKALYSLFSQYGTVLDVVATKSLKLRGQAWVIFREIVCATVALRSIQSTNMIFFEKPMKIAYAKTKSDAIKKSEGTYEPKPKKPRVARPPKIKNKRPAGDKTENTPNKKRKTEHNPEQQQQPSSATAVTTGNSSNNNTAVTLPPVQEAVGIREPHKILYIQNLPDAANPMMMSMLFRQFPGYKDVRLLAGKKRSALVEFNSINEASVAMKGLQNFMITHQHPMVINYANK